MIALVAIGLGLGLGVSSGGSVSNLARFRLRFETALITLFLVQAVARGRIAGAALPGAIWVWAVASIGLAVVLLSDYRRPGMAVAALGVLLNLDATLVNAGMPVTGSAHEVGAAVAGSRGLYALSGSQTIAGWLGDVMPIGFGHERLLLSVGDVLLLAGVVAVVVSAMSTVEPLAQPQG